MKKAKNQVNTVQLLFLFIFPAFCIVTGGYFRTLLGDLSLRSIDPDYVYFSNALGISLGNFDTGNIFHPGTPLQYFAAIIFRLVYLLRSPEAGYLEDIFTHPDLYLSVVSFSFTGILSIILFIAGWYVFRITNSILTALVIQTSTFLPIIWYDLIGRVTPEVYQAIAVIALSVVVINYYKKEIRVNNLRQILLLAFISAFGLSVKVTFLPVLIIPLFMIFTWKRKLLFLVFTFFMFLVLSVPVLLKLDVFWTWIKNILIHSGDYGKGESTIIDFQLFKTNLVYLVKLEKFFFQIIFLSVLILSAYLITFRKKAQNRVVIYTSSIILTIIIQLILVSKHFAHRNFIPSLMLMPLLVFFSVEIIKLFYNNRMYCKATELLFLIFIVLILKNQFLWLPIKSNAMGSHVNALEETRFFASTLEKESIKIITSQNYGAPLKEYALMYSTVWSNRRLKPLYDAVLRELYPSTYQHTTWDDRFQHWGEPFNALQFANEGIQVYLFIERDDQELFNRTMSKLIEVSKTEFSAESELIYRNPVTSEVIYQLHFSPVELNSMD